MWCRNLLCIKQLRQTKWDPGVYAWESGERRTPSYFSVFPLSPTSALRLRISAWFNFALFWVTGADRERWPGWLAGGERRRRGGQLREKRV